jgi:hypothetical protein
MTSRKNRDGKPIKLVLSWLAGRELADSDLAIALGVDKTYYSRHKDDPEYPSFEDLETLATAFGFDARALQISFGYREVDELILLDYRGMHEYMEMGGGNYPNPDRDDVNDYVTSVMYQLRKARASLPPGKEVNDHAKEIVLEVASTGTPKKIMQGARQRWHLDTDGQSENMDGIL